MTDTKKHSAVLKDGQYVKVDVLRTRRFLFWEFTLVSYKAEVLNSDGSTKYSTNEAEWVPSRNVFSHA